MPILPGHCTRPEDLVGVTWRDWVADADQALRDLLGEVDHVIVVGLSMGGLVAFWLALEHPNQLAGVVAIAPALRLADTTVPFAPLLARARSWVDVSMRAYSDPELARLNTNYTRIPITVVQELVAMQRAVEPRLPELQVPLLVVGARRDRVVRPSRVTTVHMKAGSADKRLVWLERSGHEMLRDLEREAVMDFVDAYVTERRAALATGPVGPTPIQH